MAAPVVGKNTPVDYSGLEIAGISGCSGRHEMKPVLPTGWRYLISPSPAFSLFSDAQ
jgi:hypothetical protein